MEAYKKLKDEHPQRLVGIRVDDTLLFYGDDAKTAAPLMDTRLFERDIPGMGTISVTGMPFGRWRVAAKALTESGHGIFFAEPAEYGGYEVVKELDGRTDTPHYQVGDTVYLGNTAFIIEEVTDTHVTMRDPTLLYPISRIEPRENFERMLAEDARNAVLFEEQTEPAQAKTDKLKPPDEQVRENVDAETSVESKAKAEQPKAQNFHITDDHLGEGGAKTKYAFNLSLIHI